MAQHILIIFFTPIHNSKKTCKNVSTSRKIWKIVSTFLLRPSYGQKNLEKCLNIKKNLGIMSQHQKKSWNNVSTSKIMF